MSAATCARCSSEILTGRGYSVYPYVSTGIAADHRVFFSTEGPGACEAGDVQCKELDAVLCCDQCASALFTREVWSNATALRIEMPPEDVDGPEGKKARFEVIESGVAIRMKRLGMTPSQARRVARASGERWWMERSAAERNLLAQSNTPAQPGEAPNSIGARLLLMGLASLLFALPWVFFWVMTDKPQGGHALLELIPVQMEEAEKLVFIGAIALGIFAWLAGFRVLVDAFKRK
jgi:hypothetical protein